MQKLFGVHRCSVSYVKCCVYQRFYSCSFTIFVSHVYSVSVLLFRTMAFLLSFVILFFSFSYFHFLFCYSSVNLSVTHFVFIVDSAIHFNMCLCHMSLRKTLLNCFLLLDTCACMLGFFSLLKFSPQYRP